ncbi:MAG: polysaccharide biosynthesis/export family protein [Terracidiphilus sp.]
MKIIRIICLTLFATCVCLAQQEPAGLRVGPGETTDSKLSNLPIEKLGVDDLVGISVYDAPELTRTVRVNAHGDIRLPMLTRPVHAAGLYPDGLEKAITTSLIAENVLVDPVVTVTVVEYQSRPITVVGAVKTPLTFQATGNVTLLDAISRAGGFSEKAGALVLISRPSTGADANSNPLLQRVPVQGLLDGSDPTLNVALHGGEEVRVPEAGRVFVLGDVKKPGAYYLTDGPDSSVLKALALSEGLDSFAGRTAYIYRREAGKGDRNEIAVPLRKIIERKAPDVNLQADDIFYIPNATGARASLKVLEASVGVGAALGSAFIYYGSK